MKSELIYLLFISLLSFIIFGFIDALFFGIYLNEGAVLFFEKIGLNENNSDVMVGALAAATALIVSTYIKKKNQKTFGELIESPILDVAGILIGTYLYILIARNVSI
jgi:Na+/melibiose symporter-like transporter